MDQAFQKKLIEKLAEMVRCSEVMNCILKEQEAALKTEAPDGLLQSINDMDECRCQLLDLDRELSDLRASTKLFRQAMKIPQVRELLERANSLQQENTNLLLSNRDLIDAKVACAPEDIKELFDDRNWGALPLEDFPPLESSSLTEEP